MRFGASRTRPSRISKGRYAGCCARSCRDIESSGPWLVARSGRSPAGIVTYKTGDILREDAEALVNAVNCVGVMGRGVALEFKRAWPENFTAYVVACRSGEVRPGRMFVFENRARTGPRYIINFPTKRHWRDQPRMADIEAGLSAVVEEVRRREIRSLALPPLGAGLGGLDWADVRPRIERAVRELQDVNVVVFEPRKQAAAESRIHG